MNIAMRLYSNSTRCAAFARQTFVTRFAVWLCVLWVVAGLGRTLPHPISNCSQPSKAATTGLSLLNSIFQRLTPERAIPSRPNRAFFICVSRAVCGGSTHRPPASCFISDGKDVFLYTPDEQQAEEEQAEAIGRYARAAGVSAWQTGFRAGVQIVSKCAPRTGEHLDRRASRNRTTSPYTQGRISGHP